MLQIINSLRLCCWLLDFRWVLFRSVNFFVNTLICLFTLKLGSWGLTITQIWMLLDQLFLCWFNYSPGSCSAHQLVGFLCSSPFFLFRFSISSTIKFHELCVFGLFHTLIGFLFLSSLFLWLSLKAVGISNKHVIRGFFFPSFLEQELRYWSNCLCFHIEKIGFAEGNMRMINKFVERSCYFL